MNKPLRITPTRLILSLLVTVCIGVARQGYAQADAIPVGSEAAYERCKKAFGLTYYDDQGNMYVLVGWRFNATGGATCYYEQY